MCNLNSSNVQIIICNIIIQGCCLDSIIKSLFISFFCYILCVAKLYQTQTNYPKTTMNKFGYILMSVIYFVLSRFQQCFCSEKIINYLLSLFSF